MIKRTPPVVWAFLPLVLFAAGAWAAIRQYREQPRDRRAAARLLRSERIRERVAEGELSATSFALRTALGLALLLALIGLNYLVFRALFETNYFAWYLANGTLIAILFALISAVGGLDAIPTLISKQPFVYLGGVAQLVSFVEASWGSALRVKSPSEIRLEGDVDAAVERLEPVSWPHAAAIVLDFVLVALFIQILALATFAWIVVVMPLQYFLNLVCGAPARMAVEARDTAVYDPAELELTFSFPKGRELPKGALRLGYQERPVAFTASVGAGLLWVASQFV